MKQLELNIPDKLKQNVKTTFGERGEQWLASLPQLVSDFCFDWQLQLGGQFDDLTYSFVAPVKQKSGTPAVLKLRPYHKDVLREVLALECFNGQGSVKLLKQNTEQGAVLLEKLVQPSSVTTENFCEVASKLFSSGATAPVSKKFSHISIWGLGFEKFSRTHTQDANLAREAGLTDGLVAKADQIFKKLVLSTERETLLHGDLHHANILKREIDEWVAIDPKGVWGDPCFEVGAFLRNPMPQILDAANLDEVLEERVNVISKLLGFNSQRVSDWGFAQAVLAAIWAIADGPEAVRDWLRISRVLG